MILDYPQIGKNLAKRRKELKLKQYEVCERAEINDKYLSCIETARSIPSLEVFLRLCTALETTPDRILFGTVRQTDYTKDSTILLEKFQRLSPNNKRPLLGRPARYWLFLTQPWTLADGVGRIPPDGD